MFNTDTDMLFPLRIVPSLGDLRGDEWQKLVQRISEDKVDNSEKIAFTYLMVKMAGCANCNADSFRAMRGCTQCSRQIIKRFKGSDQDLLKSYHECHTEVKNFLQKRDLQV